MLSSEAPMNRPAVPPMETKITIKFDDVSNSIPHFLPTRSVLDLRTSLLNLAVGNDCTSMDISLREDPRLKPKI